MAFELISSRRKSYVMTENELQQRNWPGLYTIDNVVQWRGCTPWWTCCTCHTFRHSYLQPSGVSSAKTSHTHTYTLCRRQDLCHHRQVWNSLPPNLRLWTRGGSISPLL